MSDGTCAVPTCERPSHARGWCKRHYERWRTTGTTELPPPRTRSECSVSGCTSLARSASATLCPKHYHRKYRHGWVHAHAPTSGVTASHGRRYRRVTAPWRDHPIADKDGRGYEHRFVLFGAIGYGPHLCHWCNDPVGWYPKGHAHCLTVDHLNAIGDDNRPENLVPACGPCNGDRGAAARTRALRAAGFYSAHDTVGRIGGRKVRTEQPAA